MDQRDVHHLVHEPDVHHLVHEPGLPHPQEQPFTQEPPRLRDEWEDDHALRSYLRRVLPADVLADVEPSLAAMGRLAVTELHDLHTELDQRANEPTLTTHDAWGSRADHVELAPAWERIGAHAARHGLVATGYERAHGAFSRVHQFALAYLFVPSSAMYACPLAMTDGAVATLLAHDADGARELVARLTSRDPDSAWTSGQWMTERTGGSDVSRTATTAREIDGAWHLTGSKWFASAFPSNMAMVLARPVGNADDAAGLAAFRVDVRRGSGGWNGLRVVRLKDKLGTRQLPTAELELEGTVAHLVGPSRHGVRTLAPMLRLTRLWNAVSAAAYSRRGLALARDYARRRQVAGGLLIEQPLHQATLAGLRVRHEAGLQLAFRAVELLGREEAGEATDEEQRVLRLIVPLAKLVTGKEAVGVASEALEAIGGVAYMEDSHLPVLLRDSQVLPIWEGTTNVLALDALRALHRDEALAPFVAEVERHARRTRHPTLVEVARQGVAATHHCAAWVDEAVAAPGLTAIQHGARRFALTLGRALQAVLLAAQGQHDLDVLHDARTAAVARRFAAEGLDLLEPAGIFEESDAALARDDPLDVTRA